jgi:hypothetical protein
VSFPFTFNRRQGKHGTLGRTLFKSLLRATLLPEDNGSDPLGLALVVVSEFDDLDLTDGGGHQFLKARRESRQYAIRASNQMQDLKTGTHPDALLLDVQRQVADDDLQSLARRLLLLLHQRVHAQLLLLRSTGGDRTGVLGPSARGLSLLLRTGRSGGTGSGSASAGASASGTFGSGGDDLRERRRGGV